MKKFGLIGKFLEHTWSKDYFDKKFVHEGIINCEYENIALNDLKGFKEMVYNDTALSGFNITIPYKIEIRNYIDKVDSLAADVGAVNCLKIDRDGKHAHITGYNTDMPAFRETLKPLLNESYRQALVLGTGGAARAVCYALDELNIGYSLVSRKKQPGLLEYHQITSQVINNHLLIINATPVGMFPDSDQCPPLPFESLSQQHLLYDLVYNPEKTLFLKTGSAAGAKIKCGLEMLELQAELSWKIWNQ